MTGAVLERTFSPTDKYPTAHIETREMQYLYTDGDLYYFMDNESYEQLALNHEQVEDAIDFVVETPTSPSVSTKAMHSPLQLPILLS